MKFITYIWVLTWFIPAIGQEVNQSILTLPLNAHDFGYVKQDGGKVKHRFVVQNNSDSSFVITNVRSTCNCAAPFWTQTPIAPGAEGLVDIEFDPKDYNGAFHKTIQLLSTAFNSNMFLTISGIVIPPVKKEELKYTIGSLKIQKNRINLGYLYKGSSKVKRIAVYNPTKTSMELDFGGSPDYIGITAIPNVLEPGSFGQLELTYCSDNDDQWYVMSDEVTFEINGEPVVDEKLMVLANIREDFRELTEEDLKMAPIVGYDKDSIIFDNVTDTTILKCDFLVSNNGKSDLKIRTIRSTCGCTVATPEKTVLAPGESTYIHASFDPANRSGKVSNGITVITNDPKQYKKQLYIDAVVKIKSD